MIIEIFGAFLVMKVMMGRGRKAFPRGAVAQFPGHEFKTKVPDHIH
jgi:hypothetical protein